MDNRTYHSLLERIQNLSDASDAERLGRDVLDEYGETQRRWMILVALEERRAILANVAPGAITAGGTGDQAPPARAG